MELCYCERCHKWIDIDDSYDEIAIGKKSGDRYYEMLHFCQECGKKMHKAIEEFLSESEDNDHA